MADRRRRKVSFREVEVACRKAREILKAHGKDSSEFFEAMGAYHNKLYQLTKRRQQVFTYDSSDLISQDALVSLVTPALSSNLRIAREGGISCLRFASLRRLEPPALLALAVPIASMLAEWPPEEGISVPPEYALAAADFMRLLVAETADFGLLSGLAEAGSFYPLLGSFTSLGLHDWGASSSKVLTQLRHNVVESVSLIVSAIAFATTPEPFLGDATGPPPSSSELPGAAAAEAEHPVMQAIIQLAGGATPEVFQSTRGSLIEAVEGTTGFMKACRRLWLSAGNEPVIPECVARLLAVLITLQPSLAGTMIDQGIFFLAAAATRRVLKPGEADSPSRQDFALVTVSTLLMDALLPSLLGQAGMRPSSQQQQQPGPSSSLPDNHQERGLPDGRWIEQYARNSPLTPEKLAVVASIYLAREGSNFRLWPEAQLRSFLASFKLASQQRIEQCQGQEELVALAQEAAADLVPAHAKRFHGWPAAAGLPRDGGAAEDGEAGGAPNQPAEVVFPPVLPRDQAWLHCAVCGMGREEVALKECVGCKRFYYCSRACQLQQWPEHRRFCKLSKRFNAWKEGKDPERIRDMTPEEQQEFLPLLRVVQPELARAAVRWNQRAHR